MKAKDFLQRAYYLDIRLGSNLRELSELRSMVYSIQTPELEERCKSSIPATAPFVKTLEMIDDLERVVNNETDRLIKAKAEIRDVINEVSNQDCQMVLRYRYIHFNSWEEISNTMNFSMRWIFSLHHDALKAVEKILEKREFSGNSALQFT